MDIFDRAIRWVEDQLFPGCVHDVLPPAQEPLPVLEDPNVIQVRSRLPADVYSTAEHLRLQNDPRSAVIENWIARFERLQDQREQQGLPPRELYFNLPSYALNLYVNVDRREAVGPRLGTVLLNPDAHVELQLGGRDTSFNPLQAGYGNDHHLNVLVRGLSAGIIGDVIFENGRFDFSRSDPLWNIVSNLGPVNVSDDWLRYYLAENLFYAPWRAAVRQHRSQEHNWLQRVSSAEIEAASRLFPSPQPESSALSLVPAQNFIDQNPFQTWRGANPVYRYDGHSWSLVQNDRLSVPQDLSTPDLGQFLRANPLARIGYSASGERMDQVIRWDELLDYLIHRDVPPSAPEPASSSDNTLQRMLPHLTFSGTAQMRDFWSSGILVLLSPRNRENLDSSLFPSLCFSLDLRSADLLGSARLRSLGTVPWDLIRLPGGITLGSGEASLQAESNSIGLHLSSALEPFELTSQSRVMSGRIQDGPEFRDGEIVIPGGLQIQRLPHDEYVLRGNLTLNTRVQWTYDRRVHQADLSGNLLLELHFARRNGEISILPGRNLVRLRQIHIREVGHRTEETGNIVFSDIHPEQNTQGAASFVNQSPAGAYLVADLNNFFGELFVPLSSDANHYRWRESFANFDSYWRAWLTSRQQVNERHLPPNFQVRAQSNSPASCQRHIGLEFGHNEMRFFYPTLRIHEGHATGEMNFNILETGVMNLTLGSDLQGNWYGALMSAASWSRIFFDHFTIMQGLPQIPQMDMDVNASLRGNCTADFSTWAANGSLDFTANTTIRGQNGMPSVPVIENLAIGVQLHEYQGSVQIDSRWNAQGARAVLEVPADAPGYTPEPRATESNAPIVGRMGSYPFSWGPARRTP